jgi:hypothetical protein
MAVRERRGARLRRAARGRAGVVALACGLYLGAGVSTTWPAVEHARSSFLAGGAAGHGEAAPGDHLQTLYHLWLVGHQLEDGRAPWLDPYSFRPESPPTPNLAGWPYGLVYWPLGRLLGTVGGWNALVLLTYLAAGGLACLWLRELDLPLGASLAGGLAFAIAPYRVAQSTGHLLGPISILLPLALLAFELGRRRGLGWLLVAVAAVVSIPLSGQVHLALGAVPFFFAYGLVRACDRRTLVAVGVAVVAAAGAGVLVRQTTILHSHLAAGRALHSVDRYSASWSDFLSRHQGREPERFVFLGWLTPLLALAGLALLARARRGLAVVLGLGALVPILLALGTRTPLYSAVWHTLPPFRYPRVPERLLPVACLCVAALVAFAVARLPRAALVSAIAVAALAVDLHVHVYDATAAGEGNRAYTALRREPPGRLLELPIFYPDLHYGGVYQYYSMQAPRERPAGYSTVAPRDALDLMIRLRPLNCGRGDLPRRLGVRYVAIHDGLYRGSGRVRPACRGPALRRLRALGFRPVAEDGAVSVWRAGPARRTP